MCLCPNILLTVSSGTPWERVIVVENVCLATWNFMAGNMYRGDLCVNVRRFGCRKRSYPCSKNNSMHWGNFQHSENSIREIPITKDLQKMFALSKSCEREFLRPAKWSDVGRTARISKLLQTIMQSLGLPYLDIVNTQILERKMRLDIFHDVPLMRTT